MKDQNTMKYLLRSYLVGSNDNKTLYKKSGTFDARKGVLGELIVTEINGVVETTNTVKSEDEVVIRGPAGELYIVPDKKFRERYTTGGKKLTKSFKPFKAKGMIRAMESPYEPFEFVASWGEKMICNPGDYIACPVKSKNDFILTEVYRIERSVFDKTYAQEKL